MMITILDAVDWLEVILYLPVWFNLFGAGLCLQGLVIDF